MAEKWSRTSRPNQAVDECELRWDLVCDWEKESFIAGYEAAKKEERLKLSELYSHGSDVQKIASAYLKSKGIEGALLPYAENRFIDGYVVAQEHAHAALEEAESRIDELQSKLSDAGILTTEHLLGADNSSNNSNGWISVKDRLPDKDSTVLVYTKDHDTYMAKIYEDGEAWPISNSCGCCGGEEKFTHWMPLPAAPKEEA